MASGEYALVSNAAGASIHATGEVDLFGGGFATGIVASGVYGVDVVNDGDILVYGHAHAFTEGEHGFYGAAQATGIDASAVPQGEVSVVNNGDIVAIALAEDSVGFAQGGAGAVGINAYAKYDATIVNSGDILATAQAEFGITGAYGAIAHGKYSSHIVNAAGASIVASASVGSLEGDQYAGRAVSFGTQTFGTGMEYAVTYNAGSIVSHAVVTPDGTGMPIGSIASAFGSTIGYNSGITAGTLTNVGSIEAAASADFGYASAYGAFVRTRFDSVIANTGDIRASASATGGNAFAVGSYAFSLHQTVTYNCDDTGCDWANPIVEVDGGESLIENSGDIVATASAIDGIGYSYGAVALGAYAAGITNAGHISAVTEADDALAVGALANSFYGDATLQNSGVIGASATGDIARASGVIVLDADGVQLDNTGTIAAGAYGADATATAVSIESAGAHVVTNSGTIAAFGDGERVAIASHVDSSTTIANAGTIIGAITTGDLADSFTNAADATWMAYGTSSFGAGDDAIANAGTLVMQDATIDLGGYATGNAFSNAGSMFASGHNTIAMGGAFAAHNDGTISFLDGATDDVLTIVGDFAGEGTIALDVSGLSNTSDMLYVTGNVVDPTTQTLDIDLLDLPTAPFVQLPMVYVEGDSSATQFVLGNVRTRQNDFTTLDVTLNSQINTGNAARDMFYLGVNVTGLNDQGAIATALSPGVARLIDAQIGTFRQRMGVVPVESGKIGLAPFVRGFSDSGDVNPDHTQNFGAGGDYGFSQSNDGWEVGLDSRPGNNVAFGLLVSKSNGDQRLDNGAGRTDLTGTGFGLYLTYLGNQGAYVDGSVRWTGVEARLQSATSFHKTHGSANTLNLEVGLNPWIVGGIGIGIQPQLQYTFTRIADFQGLQGGSAEFVEKGGDSERARLGVMFSKNFESNGFLLTPYGSVNAVHEFNGEYAYSINDNALLGSTSLGGTSAMVELGLGARKDKWSLSGGFNWTDGAALDGLFGGQVVVRYSW
jgi:outer membrane autotransporter protein